MSSDGTRTSTSEAHHRRDEPRHRNSLVEHSSKPQVNHKSRVAAVARPKSGEVFAGEEG